MSERDPREIFLEAIKPFVPDTLLSVLSSNIDVIEQRMAVGGYMGEYVQGLQAELTRTKAMCEVMFRDIKVLMEDMREQDKYMIQQDRNKEYELFLQGVDSPTRYLRIGVK